MNSRIEKIAKRLKEPNLKTSYSSNDCIFVLNDIGNLMQEIDTLEKEKLLQSGVHYSEMLPKESVHKNEYKDFFFKCLDDSKYKIAEYVAIVSEKILLDKGVTPILVSLARAGSPIGVLIKRYIKYKYNINVPHYSISIIRGKGIDENSLIYIINKHNNTNIQFIDGWTGKGAITKSLDDSCKEFYNKYGIQLDSSLAVLCDPSNCSPIYGTREDTLLPSACLNSTVSGLVSRTVHTNKLVGKYDYHYAKYYCEFLDEDLSNIFVDTISNCFEKVSDSILPKVFDKLKEDIENIGYSETQRIQDLYNVDDINKVKPSLGETTRVLLRRIPERILVKDIKNPILKHVLFLAKEKNVLIEEVPSMLYNCIGIIDTIE